MNVSLFDIAQRFVGLKEIPGSKHNDQILAMLRLDQEWPEGDEVPWCSAFVNYCAWLLRLPRSKSLRARSWLQVGKPVGMPVVGYDVVILTRGSGEQPGPEVMDAPGHVGLFAGWNTVPSPSHAGLMEWEVTNYHSILLLGGNQSDSVSIAPYNSKRVLGVRRLWEGGA